MIQVTFRVDRRTDAEILVHTMTGRLVSIINLEGLLPATYTYGIDLKNRSRVPLSPGIYFVTLQSGYSRETVKLILGD